MLERIAGLKLALVAGEEYLTLAAVSENNYRPRADG